MTHPDFDPKAKNRSAELREEMRQASQEIAKDPGRLRAAEREGIAPQVRNFVRQAQKERGREKARDHGKDYHEAQSAADRLDHYAHQLHRLHDAEYQQGWRHVSASDRA